MQTDEKTNPMENDIYDRIAKFLSGETQEIEPDLKEWINQKESNRIVFDSLRFHWTKPSSIDKKSKDELYQKIHARLENSKSKTLNSTPVRPMWQQIGRVAAILILLAGLSWVVLDYSKTTKVEPVISLIEKENPNGRKSTFTLSDGTVVKLNSDSRFEFPSQFGEEKREVVLEGEAFFEVSENREKPFIIRTGNITTTVLGTTFNVKAYPNENEVNVALVSGRVAVENTKESSREEPLILKPNQMAVYNSTSDELKASSFDYSEVISWKDGVLALKNADLSQIKSKLEKWYGVDIIYKNTPGNHGDVTANYIKEPLDNVLKSLGHTMKFDYAIDGKRIEIIFNDQ